MTLETPAPLQHSVAGPEDGPPVVLLHGFPLDRTMWGAQVAALGAAGYRVITPDLRGLGKTPPASGPATMETHAEDVRGLVDQLGIQRFVLAGFSMGGYVALEFARTHADRLAGLALLDTRAEADTPDAKKARLDTVEAVRREGAEALMPRFFPKLLTERTRAENAKVVDHVRRMIRATNPAGAEHALLAMRDRADQKKTLAKLEIPVLILVGEEDTLTPPDAARAMVERAPQARLMVLAAAAHLTPLERPQEVNDALLAWLRATRAAAPPTPGV